MKAGTFRILLMSALLSLAALVWDRDGFAQDTGKSLRTELEALADQQGLTLSGIDKLENGVATAEGGGNLARRLDSLLKGYNYLLTYDTTGTITALRILGKSPSAEELEQRASVATRRYGNHHVVEAILVGPRGDRRTLPMLVDTGASTVVLPSSMIEEFGFKPSELRDGVGQTAAGPVNVKLGQLYSVQIGQAHLRNVAVGFIDDDKIGKQNLLGMSFLGRFRMTIDDEGDRMILLPK